MKRRTTYTSLVALFTVLILVSCSDNEQQANQQLPFNPNPPGGTPIPPPGGTPPGTNNNTTSTEPLAECNTFSFSKSGSSGQLKTFYSTNGTYDSSKIRLRFLSVDNQFGDNGDVYFDFYRWRANQSSFYIDPTAMTFDVVERRTNVSIGTFSSLKFNSSQLTTLASRNGTSTSISDYDFIIRGTSLDYQVIRAAMKKPNGSTTDTIIDETDFLIPAFTANPTVYATTHAAILNQIHPFYSRTGSWTSADYKSMISGEGCW